MSYPSLGERHLLYEELSNKVLIHFIGVLGYLGLPALEPLMLTS